MEKKILILEDEKEVAQIYAKRLQAKGYATELAYNGFEGLNKLKEITPDLILLDVNMPKMGGLEFYQHICDSQQKPKFPVLVLTGRADLEILFKEFHVAGILIKPFESSRLLNEVDIILNKQYWQKTDGSAKKVIIIDDDRESAKKILAEFSRAGFKSDIATGGISGIEKIMADPPDLAMVKLGLTDLSGDVVILRLQQIARTRKTSTILYIPRGLDLDKNVMKKIEIKSGITTMLEYDYPFELIEAAKGVFQKLEQKN